MITATWTSYRIKKITFMRFKTVIANRFSLTEDYDVVVKKMSSFIVLS